MEGRGKVVKRPKFHVGSGIVDQRDSNIS